jgi:isopenicillin-N N-acyltransferase-like protein
MTRREWLGMVSAGAAAGGTAAPPVPDYPVVSAKGGHRELGRQHGEQAKERMELHLERMAKAAGGREKVRARAAAFLPLFERYCPHLLEEIRGLGEGAGVAFADALACNIRGEISRAPSGGCTALALGPRATASGQPIAGQNADLPADHLELGYVLHLQPRGKPQTLFWTFGGMIGYHGMNSAGVCQFANALGGGPAGRFALPHYPLKRLLLECTSLAEVRKLFERVPLASNGNYVLCDGAGAVLDVEATTEGPQFLHHEGRGFLVHANHFLCPRYATAANHGESWQDSFGRQERMTALVAGRAGKITVEDVKAFLRDHAGNPSGICRHGGKDSITAASLIAEPARRCLHVATGNPCAGRYVAHYMKEV